MRQKLGHTNLLGMLSNPDPVDDMESLDEGTKADDENDSTDKNNQTSGESDLEKGSVIICCQKLTYFDPQFHN